MLVGWPVDVRVKGAFKHGKSEERSFLKRVA